MIERSQQRSGGSICLGLDPRLDRHPHAKQDGIAAVARDYKALLTAVADNVAAVKPQAAFFEAHGLAGLSVLSDLMNHARSLGLPVIMDAKRGDIGTTASAYAQAYLQPGDFEADALTVNPFLGFDTIEPFVDLVERSEKGIFVLVATSNPGRSDVQQAVQPGSNVTVSETLADWVRAANERLGFTAGDYGPVGAVVGATTGEMLKTMRGAMPNAPLLVPGYGAQGATAQDAANAFDAQGGGALINASRSLLYPGGEFTVEASIKAVTAMKQSFAALA
jgi:orotidine-5'-phosphate decarboxylase